MLEILEETNPQKRECTGRGQLERDWQSTVRNAANALRRVPHHGEVTAKLVSSINWSVVHSIYTKSTFNQFMLSCN